jgi:hypothetical protein
MKIDNYLMDDLANKQTLKIILRRYCFCSTLIPRDFKLPGILIPLDSIASRLYSKRNFPASVLKLIAAPSLANPDDSAITRTGKEETV